MGERERAFLFQKKGPLANIHSQLLVLSPFPKQFKGAKVPTLLEFMELIKDLPDMTVDFELKEYPVPGWENTAYSVCDRVMKIIDAYDYTDRCVINTFNGKLHGYIHEKYGKKYRQHVYYPPAYMGEYDAEPYTYAYCSCMFRSVKKDYDWMRNRGVQPWAGASVKDAETVDQAIADGAVTREQSFGAEEQPQLESGAAEYYYITADYGRKTEQIKVYLVQQ